MKLFKSPVTKKQMISFICIILTLCTFLVGCEKSGGFIDRTGLDDDRPANDDGRPSVDDDDGEDQDRDDDTPSKDTEQQGNEDTSKKRVALTFDDGPHQTRTKLIADELAKYGAHATFFVVGNRVDGTVYDGGAALKYAYDKGNEIAIHGYTHNVYYSDCAENVFFSELSKTKSAIQSVIPSYKVKHMRPIGGRITASRVSSSPYSVILWSVDSEDWKYRSEQNSSANVAAIVNNVMSSVKDGDIILMHDLYQNTYEATKIILKRLYEQGYEVVTVSELLDNKAIPGMKYSNAK